MEAVLVLYMVRRTRRNGSPPSPVVRHWGLLELQKQHSRQKLAMTYVLLSAVCASLHVQRCVWMKLRSSHFWKFIVKGSFSERVWYEKFRTRKQTFDYLCSKLQPAIEKRNTVLHAAVCVEQRVAVSVWCLALGVEYRTVAHLFGISVASVCLIVRNVLMPKYIRLPKTGNELVDTVAGFQDTLGFPNCMGAFDGSHMPISAPSELQTDYYKRKGWYSVVLQSLFDAKHRFMDVCVGWPGSVHDARVFANSELYCLGSTGTLFPRRTIEMDGVDAPVVILGDSAYSLFSWLITPFLHGCTYREQRSFNYQWSRARMVIEKLMAGWRGLEGGGACSNDSMYMSTTLQLSLQHVVFFTTRQL